MESTRGILVYTTVYGAWGEDEREVLGKQSETIETNGDEFDSPVVEALAYLRREGFGTDGSDWDAHAWLTASYEHPYPGGEAELYDDTLTEQHAVLNGFSPEASRYIWAELS
jgi:hypothetical protein